MKKFFKKQPSNLSHWALLREENDCSFAVDIKNALTARWAEGLSGKVAVIGLSLTVIAVTIITAMMLQQFLPIFDPSR